MSRRRLRSALAALSMIACLAAPPARAGTAGDAVAGAGAAICSLVYAPLKLTYAAGGLVVSGMAWLWTFGDSDVAGPIFRGALGGDYVVMPAHLRGDRDLRFVGR